MIKRILSEENGTFPNVWECLEQYELAKTPIDRAKWESEFLHWNNEVMGVSMMLFEKYRARFDKLKTEYEHERERWTYKGGPYGN